MPRTPWWKSPRGENYVLIQSVLILLIAAGPRTVHHWPPWPFPHTPVVTVAGILMILAGGSLSLAGVLKLGSKLTPLPYPVEGAALHQTGPYRLVRHPIYCGAILCAFGWALFRHGWLTLAYSALLFLLFDLKTRREETWLLAKFPEYESYRRRVRKLIPWVY